MLSFLNIDYQKFVEQTYDQAQNFIANNPHYGYLIASVGFGIFLLGFVRNWNWVMEPGGGIYNIAYWENRIGNRNVRIVMGITCGLAMISTLGLFLYYNR